MTRVTQCEVPRKGNRVKITNSISIMQINQMLSMLEFLPAQCGWYEVN